MEEINRLRNIYRKDLPLYEITESNRKATKREFNIAVDEEAPLPKKYCEMVPPRKPCKKRTTSSVLKNPTTKIKLNNTDDDTAACLITDVENVPQCTEWTYLRYCPVNEEWQRLTCELLGLQFRRVFEHHNGGPDTILTRPDCWILKRIMGDGNCLF